MTGNADKSDLRDPRFKPIRWIWHLPGRIAQTYMIVQATDGCHYNKCGFCYTYKEGYPGFKILSLDEVKADFETTFATYNRFHPTYQLGKNAFICDADPLVRPTAEFLEILRFLKNFEPIRNSLEVITAYARADTLLGKGEDLAELREAGLTDIYMGMESGDDEILSNPNINKGYGTDAIRDSVRASQQHGYGVHVFVISGLGGRERTDQHAERTASLLNELNPDTIIVSPLTLSAITPLGQAYQRGEFDDLSLAEKIEEEFRLVSSLNLAANIKLMGCFRCAGIGIEGKLPNDKAEILQWLRESARGSSHYKSCAPEPVGCGIGYYI